MYKFTLICFGILSAVFQSASDEQLISFRIHYIYSGLDKSNITHFVAATSVVKPNDNALLVAYKGTSISMQANIVKGKLNKYQTFMQGTSLIDKAIMKDKHNAEIRYLRFTIQVHAPKFLGYNNIDEDKMVLISNLPELAKISDKEFVRIIKKDLLASGQFTKQEQAQISAIL